MKYRIFQLLFAAFLCFSFVSDTADSTSVKCLIQMKNYTGEAAYIVVSIVNEDKEYVETIYVHGKDPEWYSEISSWWKFYGKRRPDIDAISGATIAGGNRAMTVLKIPADKINNGHSLRFETAVEDQEYYETDLEIELSDDKLKSKLDGSGWIRYVRLMPQK